MRVPDFQREVQPEALPNARQDIRVGPDNFLGANQAAFSAYAEQAARHVNHAAANIFSQQVQEANQTRVLDARNQTLNKINGTLFDPQNGLFQKQGKAAFDPQESGKPAGANALEDLQQHVNDTAEALGNDEQKRQYLEWANGALSHVSGQIQQHEGQQFRVYQRGVGVAALDTAKQTMGLNYNNPALLQSGLAGIDKAAADLAKLEGQPPELGAANALKYKSEALQGAVDMALLNNDHASAIRILHDFSSHMDPNDMLAVSGKLTQVQNATAALQIGSEVMRGIYPRMQTSDFDRILNITTGSESGNRHFGADGQPLRSPAGAVGMSQLQPATAAEAAKAAGMPWLPELFNRGQSGDTARDEEAVKYNKALGGAYLASQLKAFNGDLSMAWAAYNAGPGAVKQAVKAGGADWLSRLPAQTRAYVAKNLAAYGAGEGRFKRPTLAEVETAADAQVLKQFGANADPRLVKMAREEASNQFELRNKAIKQNDEQATGEAMRQLLLNGGKFSALPANVRAAVPADKLDNLLSFGKQIADGEPVRTDWSLYYRLKTDPALLRNTNLLAFRDKLNDTEFKQLSGEQQGAINGGHTETRTARDVLNGFMREAGIDPTPKDDDREGAAKVGKIWSAFEQRLGEAEREQGGKLSSQELEKVAARLFTRVGVRGLLSGTEEKPAVLVDWKRDKVEVPEEDRRRIIEAWRAVRPGQPISEDEVWMAYMKRKGLL